MKFQEVLGPIVDKIKATQGPPNKAELIKPLILLRIKVLKAGGIQEFVWPEFIEAFPSGGGVHNAATQAFRNYGKVVRSSAQSSRSLDPPKGSGTGKSSLGGLIRLVIVWTNKAQTVYLSGFVVLMAPADGPKIFAR